MKDSEEKMSLNKSIINLFILFFVAPIMLLSQAEVTKKENLIKYYGRDAFLIEGTVLADSLKESPYDRLPLSYKEIVREPVWNLSKSSAGISVRFITNSSRIKLKWNLLNDLTMNHMAETGIKGIDLYFNNSGTWQYVGTARPFGKENTQVIVSNMTNETREFKLYLPLYDGIESLEIGIDFNSFIEKPTRRKKKPIVFYGTSITQGGCASRPGMAHTNIISRKLNIDCINFGFSGNGIMEKPITELISEIDASLYVIECLPNMTKDQVLKNVGPLVTTIREKRPDTPIILVDNFLYESASLYRTLANELNEKNIEFKDQYDKIIKNGVPNIFYLSNQTAPGEDHEGTVDGVHFTDLGFLRYANYLIESFEELQLLDLPFQAN